MKTLDQDMNFLNFSAVCIALFIMLVRPFWHYVSLLKGNVYLGVGLYVSGITFFIYCYKLYKEQSIQYYIAIPLFILIIAHGIPMYDYFSITADASRYTFVTIDLVVAIALVAYYYWTKESV